jgi:Ca-activated chloride channel family protein
MTRMTITTLPILALLVGCRGYGFGGSSMGVTPGGSQDIALTRALIDEGSVPSRDHFTAEGLFSEHDLPLSGAPCEQSLCPLAAASLVNPVDGSGQQLLVQLGFGTNIQEDTFERSALDLSVALDISGSMQDKLPALKYAFRELVAQLDENDRLGIVTFGTVARVHENLRTMDARGKEKMLDAIADLDDGGSTDMESGMRKSIDMLESASDREGVSKRVMLFADMQPNTGATDEGSFLGMLRAAADQDIAMTVFGVGLDMGSELAKEMSEVRGGNSVFLSDKQDIKQVFEELDTLVSPIAYDLEVIVSPANGLSFSQAIGAPLDDEAGQVEMGASTLFLSRRQGGIGALLDLQLGQDEQLPELPMEIASFRISYENLDGNIVNDEISVSWEGGGIHGTARTPADQEGVYKMGSLIDEILALEAAADWCSGDLDEQEALARISAAQQSLSVVALDLADAPMSAEVALLKQLEINVRSGTEACVPADQYYY